MKEPIAWRYRSIFNKDSWILQEEEPIFDNDQYIKEPLYAAPASLAPSHEAGTQTQGESSTVELKELAAQAFPYREGTFYFDNPGTRDRFVDLAVAYFDSRVVTKAGTQEPVASAPVVFSEEDWPTIDRELANWFNSLSGKPDETDWDMLMIIVGSSVNAAPASQDATRETRTEICMSPSPAPVDDESKMWKISALIADLQATLDRFGDTCVYIRCGGLAWGAVALNRRADDEKHGIFDLQAQHDRDMEERLGQVGRLKADRDHWRDRAIAAEQASSPIGQASAEKDGD